MTSEPHNVTFETTVAASGNNTGIVVPDEVIGQLTAGKRPAVLRQATGLKAGDPIRVSLTIADAPPEVKARPTSPPALAADERASAWRQPAADRAGLAAGQIAADAADPRHRITRAREANVAAASIELSPGEVAAITRGG